MREPENHLLRGTDCRQNHGEVEENIANSQRNDFVIRSPSPVTKLVVLEGNSLSYREQSAVNPVWYGSPSWFVMISGWGGAWSGVAHPDTQDSTTH
ncbi:conserved hypothetical protein [Histoplasma capsulatum H143]|nr:conserved hypothetical protein [Histoplasma capsulatum H143]